MKELANKIRYRINKWIYYKDIAKEFWLNDTQVFIFQKEYLDKRIVDWRKKCICCWNWKLNTSEFFIKQKDRLARKCKYCKNLMRRNNTKIKNEQRKRDKEYSTKRARMLKEKNWRVHKLLCELTDEEKEVRRWIRKRNKAKQRLKLKLNLINKRLWK